MERTERWLEMSEEPTFRGFAADHRELDELFIDHQVALSELDLERARERLHEFDRRLRAHARWEDEVLLPVFESRVAPTRHGAAEIFRSEHRKITTYLDAFRERLRMLRRDDLEVRRRVLDLIDDQRIFKELMRHHAEREEKTLYPDLDRECSIEERRRMIAAAPA
jgi:hemerythrin superfamily protein